MKNYHELEELAPRDVVSRAIFEEMRKNKSTHVYLDITFKSKEYIENRFPNIYKTCLNYGIDMSKDYVPVAPAEHYSMGGIRSDVYGRTTVAGFYACGESACNGIHGANRLASNSLLEGLVFGHKIGNEVEKILKDKKKTEHISIKHYSCRDNSLEDIGKIKEDIQKIMTEYVGIIRNKEGLTKAKEFVDKYYEVLQLVENKSSAHFEIQNMVLLSKLIIESAMMREESRGAHFRSDYNKTDDIHWKKNIVRKRGEKIVESI